MKLAQKSSGYCSWTRRRSPTPSPPARCNRSPSASSRGGGCSATGAVRASSARAAASPQAAGSRARSRQASGSAPRATRRTQSRRAPSGEQTAQSSSAATSGTRTAEALTRPAAPSGSSGGSPSPASRNASWYSRSARALLNRTSARWLSRPSTKVDRVIRMASSRSSNCWSRRAWSRSECSRAGPSSPSRSSGLLQGHARPRARPTAAATGRPHAGRPPPPARSGIRCPISHPPPPAAASATSTVTASRAAAAGCRRAHRTSRSTPPRRACRDRLAPQEPAEVVGQRRRAGVAPWPAPSAGTSGRSFPGRAAPAGSAARAAPARRRPPAGASPSAVSARNGGRPVSSSYRIAPRA